MEDYALAKNKENNKIEKIDSLIQEFKGSTDDYSKEIYRSLLMEKKGLIMGWSRKEVELLGTIDINHEKNYGADTGPYNEPDY